MATGDDFTAYEIINTYKTLLYASDAGVSTIPNEGITGTLKTIRSADGSFTPLQLSSSFVNIDGASALKLNGATLTATAAELNALVNAELIENIRVEDTSGLIATQNGVVVSVINASSTLIVNPSLSVTNFIANTGSFTTKVSGVAAEFSGNVSVNNLFAATNIFIAGTTIASNADVAAVSARVDAVSVLTSINKVDITANTAAITSINTSVVANTAAITSINTVVTGNTTNITANTAAITSVNASVVANTAAITSINSAITSINSGTFNSLAVKTSITIGGTGSGNGVKALNVESLDSYSILEVGGATGGYVDLKKPFSDDFDIRLGTTGAGGHIKIGATGQTFEIIGSSETLATFTDDGSVALYHNNVKKLETAADGVDVDDINLDGKVLTITGSPDDTFKITAGTDGATTLATVDTAGAAADLTLDVDGETLLDSGGLYGRVKILNNGTQYADIHKSGNDLKIRNAISDGDFVIQGIDGGSFFEALRFDNSDAGKATFNSDVITGDINLAGKVLTITGSADDTFKITAGTNGATTLETVDTAAAAAHLTLDADGQINLDAGDASGATLFKSSGTHYGTLYNSGSNLYLESEVSDGNIIFKGNDGGVSVTPLLLDMSDAGKAYFYAGAIIDGDVTLTGAANNVVWDKSDNALEFGDNAKAVFGAGDDLKIYHDGTNNYIQTNGGGPLRLSDSTAGDMIHAESTGVRLYHAGATKLTTNAAGVSVTGVATATSFAGSGAGLTAGTTPVTTLDIDGATDIGEAITDSDLLIIDNGGGGTNRKTAASRLKTYISAGSTVALDDITTGDAASTLATSAGNITIDAQGTDTDIIFKGTDGGVDTTFLTLDGSNAGAADFNHHVHVGGNLTGDYAATFTGGLTAALATIDDILLDGKVLTITGDTGDTFKITAGTHGATTLATVDTAGALGELILDADGRIRLDAGDGYGVTHFANNGTNYASVHNSGTAFYINNLSSDGDTYIQGRDSSATAFTALRFDMSEAGKAIFNAGATFADDVTVEDINLSGKVLTITGDTSDTFTITTGAAGATTLATTDAAGSDGRLILSADGMLDYVAGDLYNQHRFFGGSMSMTLLPGSGNSGTDARFRNNVADGDLLFTGSDGGSGVTALKLDFSEAGWATFNTGATFGGTIYGTATVLTGAITAASATVDDINLDGKVITITGDTDDTFKITTGGSGATTLSTIDTAGSNGRITLDADGYIQLDANDDSGSTYFFHNGTNYGQIFTGGTSLNFRNNIDDADLRLAGKDGGSFINALILDMSEAGKAIFNAGAEFKDNVGIGTATPVTEFHIDTELNAMSGTNVDVSNLSQKIHNLQNDTGEAVGIGFGISTGGTNVGGAVTFERTDGDSRGKLHFATKGAAGEGADIPIRMTIDADGDVGIGTTAPTELLHLKSTGKAHILLEADSDNVDEADTASITLSQDGGLVVGRVGYTSGNILEIWNTNASGRTAFATNNTERMSIAPAGNVGIGVTDPLKKLHVDGPALSTVQTLTDASTVTSDFDVGQNFTLTLAGNRTLGAPSNVDAGQVGSIFIIQDGTGSRTLAYNSIWKFAGGTAPTLSTDAGAIDRLDYIVQSGTAIQALLTKAYA